MFERFTDRARRVVVLAQEEARLLNHNYIGTEHILLGLIHEGEGVAAKALESLGISLEAVRAQVEEIIGHGGSAPSGHIPFTPRAKKVLELSLREALQLGHNYIGTEHILLGLIREGEGVAAQVLVKLGADLSRVRQQVIQLLSGYAGGKEGATQGAGSGEAQPSGSLVLDQFGRNLTQLARDKKLDPVIGREKEIERVMQVLSRRTKNNPVLIGEPGVGKTAIVEGLAVRHRRRRRARDAHGQAALHARPRRARRRLPLPRRLRGAPQEGAQGDPHPRRHHPVHRRAPHARRCRRGRGRDRRRQHPQADAGPRRAPDHRRDHARRVPQAPREGRRARAPVPAHQGRRAHRRPHHRDPEGPARPLRGPPPRDDHRPGGRGGGEPRRPLHLRPSPARQGDRPHRRGRARACASAACRRRPTTASSKRRSPRSAATRKPPSRASSSSRRRACATARRSSSSSGRPRRPSGAPRASTSSTRSPRSRSPRCSRCGRASPSTSSPRRRRPSCSAWRTSCTSGSSARTTPSRPCRSRSAARVRA